MRVITLCFVLGFLMSPVVGLQADEPKKEEPKKEELEEEPLEFELGHEPAGSAVDLPAWALGNLTIRTFDPEARPPILEITVNVLPQLLLKPAETHSMYPGELVTVPLKSGIELVFYFRVKPVKIEVKGVYEKEGGGFETRTTDSYDVTLVVRKLPAAKP